MSQVHVYLKHVAKCVYIAVADLAISYLVYGIGFQRNNIECSGIFCDCLQNLIEFQQVYHNLRE